MNFFVKPCCNDQYDIRQSDSSDFLLRLFEEHTSSRRDVEQFIHHVFARAYGADIRHVLPRLMALSSRKGRLLAALGMQEATAGSLFLEQYLDAPVEYAISQLDGSVVVRDQVVEIGNLASVHHGGLSKLIIALTAYLSGAGTDWVVFTAVPAVRNAFAALDLTLHTLADADKSCLDETEQVSWGRYYDSGPTVVAGRVDDGYRRLSAIINADKSFPLDRYLWEYAFIAGCRHRLLNKNPVVKLAEGLQ
ncbi:MAG: thermostable hemolysin [Gammaproteobacteria bacterium]